MAALNEEDIDWRKSLFFSADEKFKVCSQNVVAQQSATAHHFLNPWSRSSAGAGHVQEPLEQNEHGPNTHHLGKGEKGIVFSGHSIQRCHLSSKVKIV